MSEYIYGTDGQLGHWLTDERIVRCRDCNHSHKDGTLCNFFASWAPIDGGDEYEYVPTDVEPNGFCAWAEQKEQDGRFGPRTAAKLAEFPDVLKQIDQFRELVDELLPLADYGAMDASELDRAHDLMRELGVEVD